MSGPRGGGFLLAHATGEIRRYSQGGTLLNTSYLVQGATNFRGVLSFLPEPSTMALLDLGGLMILRRRRS